MVINLLQIIILGLIQGATELLPVSSSAHVIVAEKLMGFDPTTPEAVFLLVMLHTGTMFAVIFYFWGAWKESYFSNRSRFWSVVKQAAGATFLTGVLALILKKAIETFYLGDTKTGQIEELFGRLPLIGAGLAVAGILIVISAAVRKGEEGNEEVSASAASWIGMMQAVALIFRGLSRSGSTISVGLLAGTGQRQAEEFSFGLAVILTPAVIGRSLLQLRKMQAAELVPHHFLALATPGLIGMVCSFLGGLLGLRLLSRWLAHGKWQYFGYYCFAASAGVFALAAAGW